jgi:hypothetical protein
MKNFFTYVNICIFSPTPPNKIPSNSICAHTSCKYSGWNCKICKPENLETAGSFRASTISRNQLHMIQIITSPNYQCHHHYFLVRFDYRPFQWPLYVHVNVHIYYFRVQQEHTAAAIDSGREMIGGQIFLPLFQLKMKMTLDDIISLFICYFLNWCMNMEIIPINGLWVIHDPP